MIDTKFEIDDRVRVTASYPESELVGTEFTVEAIYRAGPVTFYTDTPGTMGFKEEFLEIVEWYPKGMIHAGETVIPKNRIGDFRG